MLGQRNGGDRAARRALTRRQLLGGAALGAAGIAAKGVITSPAKANGTDTHGFTGIGDAKPVRNGLVGPDGVGWHLSGTGRGAENASIFDFSGNIAGADVRGPALLFPSGTFEDGDAIPVEFDADVRCMQGRYIDRGGHERWGTFAFI